MRCPAIISDDALMSRRETEDMVATAMMACAKATELAIAEAAATGTLPKAEDILRFVRPPMIGFMSRCGPNAREGIGNVVDKLVRWRWAA
jgi:hypothetical protein